MLSPENVLSYGPVPLSEAKLAAATSPLPYSCHDNRGQNVDGGNGVVCGKAAILRVSMKADLGAAILAELLTTPRPCW